MSKKAAKAFFEKMRTDEAFRTKVISVKDDADRMTVINAEGFDCTLEEINAIEREMSEKDMDKICGVKRYLEKPLLFSARSRVW